MVQALLTQAGWPFGSVVVQTFPPSGVAQPPQLVAVLVVSTHDPLQFVWALGQPVPQAGIPSDTVTQTGVPPSHDTPHAPQLSLLVSETHAPLQRLKPEAHEKPHVLAVHVGTALATDVVHTLAPASVPQPPQLSGSLVVSTQLALHTVGLELGQLDMHANAIPEGAQRGVEPSQTTPHPPQFCAVSWSVQAPLQRIWSAAHEPVPSSSGPSPSCTSGCPSSTCSPSGRKPPSPGAVASPHLSEHFWYEVSPERDAHAPIPRAAVAPRAKATSHRTLLRMRLFGPRGNLLDAHSP